MKVKFDLYIKEGSGTKGPRKNVSQWPVKQEGIFDKSTAVFKINA